ncbi:HopJ type III effector protein [Maribacter sp. MAR_2009_72]|uniref:HopJ type III effector protein n=1 Tax=Maribacter sp. MAR_2009_72 TaxID=1250050 RepID=UPI00119956AA|nr:HopJ type III effector protein [Maribacter sp. MAR_2009_72]TVZ16011.1 HopJ type III effector protein [Maribacter sp. MAR_2009_72]
MTIEEYKIKLAIRPKEISFSETMDVIDANYQFTSTSFTNGELDNEAGQNSGSCKVFAFAKKAGLSKDETLACFGSYYFDKVLKEPNGEGHQNIRNFMKTGFEGLHFNGEPLRPL